VTVDRTDHVLDGAGITSRAAFFDAIAVALSFPTYFGRNLDALNDLLCDLSWLGPGRHVLVWTDSATLRAADPAAFRGIREVLRDAQRETRHNDRPFEAELR